MDITLGLDFGTHQSKLCISYMPNNETIYEFIEFTLSNGSKSVLFPSIIQINKDGTIGIGSTDLKKCVKLKKEPPQQPILPERPHIVIPEEPLQKLPPEPVPPTRIPRSVPNWKKKQKKADAKYYNAHNNWAWKCRIIKGLHKDWENKCQALNKRLEEWQQTVAAKKEEYKNQYELWQRHKTEYRILRYFKQAALTTDTIKWKDEIPADLLSIWYLTYLLLYTKRYIKEKFKEEFEESVSVQMGVPSGLNDGYSRIIQYRGKKILVAARHLMNHFKDPEDLCKVPYSELIKITKYSSEDVVKEAQSYGFVVIPEAYAGLRTLTYKKRLTRGNMHLLVDIGGGTTDIAFFTIDDNFEPAVRTVSSFHKGLNYVFENFINEFPDFSIEEAQEMLMDQTDLFKNAILEYTKELKNELNKLLGWVVGDYNIEMAGTHLRTTAIIKAMSGRPIVYCGGGSIFKYMRIAQDYFSDIKLINKDTLNIPNLINRNLKPEYYTILATSYGLAIPTMEDIKTIDARQLWKLIANDVKGAPSNSKEMDEYGLIDY